MRINKKIMIPSAVALAVTLVAGLALAQGMGPDSGYGKKETGVQNQKQECKGTCGIEECSGSCADCEKAQECKQTREGKGEGCGKKGEGCGKKGQGKKGEGCGKKGEGCNGACEKQGEGAKGKE